MERHSQRISFWPFGLLALCIYAFWHICMQNLSGVFFFRGAELSRKTGHGVAYGYGVWA